MMRITRSALAPGSDSDDDSRSLSPKTRTIERHAEPAIVREHDEQDPEHRVRPTALLVDRQEPADGAVGAEGHDRGRHRDEREGVREDAVLRLRQVADDHHLHDEVRAERDQPAGQEQRRPTDLLRGGLARAPGLAGGSVDGLGPGPVPRWPRRSGPERPVDRPDHEGDRHDDDDDRQDAGFDVVRDRGPPGSRRRPGCRRRRSPRPAIRAQGSETSSRMAIPGVARTRATRSAAPRPTTSRMMRCIASG